MLVAARKSVLLDALSETLGELDPKSQKIRFLRMFHPMLSKFSRLPAFATSTFSPSRPY
jgi:hypothetical protein